MLCLIVWRLSPQQRKPLVWGFHLAILLNVVIGSDDEYISPSQIAQQQQQLQQLGATPTLITFSGRHELNREILAQLASLEG